MMPNWVLQWNSTQTHSYAYKSLVNLRLWIWLNHHTKKVASSVVCDGNGSGGGGRGGAGRWGGGGGGGGGKANGTTDRGPVLVTVHLSNESHCKYYKWPVSLRKLELCMPSLYYALKCISRNATWKHSKSMDNCFTWCDLTMHFGINGIQWHKADPGWIVSKKAYCGI